MTRRRATAATVVAAAGLLCGALLAASSSSSGVRAAAAPALPATNYPEPARSADGGNPLDALPKPEECPPVRGGAAPSGYARLSELPQREADDPSIKGEPASVVLRFVNRKRQRFRIFVSGGSKAAIGRYVDAAAACLEWIGLRGPLPTVPDQVSFDRPLVAAAVQATDLSEDSLNALQDSLPAPATLADVLAASGKDPAAVVEAAASVVSSELAARVSAGALTAAEVAALDVPKLLRKLVDEPGAPFLFGSSETPSGADAAGRFLRADTRGSVLITMQALGRVPRRSWIWAGFDPDINGGTIHGYKAKCQTGASVRIWVNAGAAAVRFWRAPKPPNNTEIASAVDSPSDLMQHHSSMNRTYDTNVKGLQKRSNYTISAGWSQGTGGGC